MHKHYHGIPDLAQLRREKQLIDAVSKAYLLITLTILYTEAGWDADGLTGFTDRYLDFVDQYEHGKVSLQELSDGIKEICGIEIIRATPVKGEKK